MTDTLKLFHLAQLAEASYAKFDEYSSDDTYSFTEVRNALIDQDGDDYNFSPTQAGEFIKNWQVEHHEPDTGSGYSGTLFRYIGNDPNSGFSSGEHVFSLRGTETGWPWVEHVTYIIRSTGIKRNIF